MLTDLFPKYHRRYAESLVADWLAGFADWLVSAGYARDPAHNHVRRLKQVLECRESVSADAKFSGLCRVSADKLNFWQARPLVFKLDGFVLPMHKIDWQKTAHQCLPSSAVLCESYASIRCRPRHFWLTERI